MKKVTKKRCILNCFLILAMAFMFFKADIVKADTTEGEKLWYEDYLCDFYVDSNGVNCFEICGYSGNETSLYIPAKVTIADQTYQVVVASPFAMDKSKKKITRIQFEEGVRISNDCSMMFSGMNALKTINVEVLNTSNVYTMDAMFYNCNNLSKLNLSEWDTSNVNNMSFMFYGCKKIKNLNLKKWNTSKVTDMSDMFSWCENLQKLDLRGWNTSKVMKMDTMFSLCLSLQSIDLSTFDMRKVSFDKNNPLSDELFLRCASLKTIKTPKRLKVNIPISNTFDYKVKGRITNYKYIPKGNKSVTLVCNQPKAKATKITNVSSKNKKITLTWESILDGIDGMPAQYEVQCSTNKNFTDKVGKMVNPIKPGYTYASEYDVTENTSATIKGLEKGKTYYVRVRVIEFEKRISSWSKAKKIKVK